MFLPPPLLVEGLFGAEASGPTLKEEFAQEKLGDLPLRESAFTLSLC